MRKKIYYCDLCGKEIRGQRMTLKAKISPVGEEKGKTAGCFDICEDCTSGVLDELEKFFGEKTEPKQEKPKAAKPKKEKTAKQTIDRGKVMALHKAGWPAGKIADEMGCSVQAIYLITKAEQEKREAET